MIETINTNIGNLLFPVSSVLYVKKIWFFDTPGTPGGALIVESGMFKGGRQGGTLSPPSTTRPPRFSDLETCLICRTQFCTSFIRKFYAIFDFPIFYLKPLNKNILYLLLSLNYRRDSILSLSLPAYLGSHTSKMRNNKPRVKQERESVKQIRGVFIA